VTVQDEAGTLSYSGASDFVDGADSEEEYEYDDNGALTKDLNRGITCISYDDLGNPTKISFTVSRSIEYVYSADGTKLRTIHKKPKLKDGLGGFITIWSRDTTEYIGNLILKNSHPEMLQFDGGFASFSHDTIDGLHYYILDYQGNNRMVVNLDGTIEQVTHYYPYGGVIGDISTNENLQKYKFEGKELDRTFGLDNYDIHARQYFAMAPMWDRIDPMAEKYYGISPYAYCEGDPVNLGDYNGKQFITFMGTSNPIMLGTSEVIVSGRTPILGTADKVSTLGRSASESQNSKLLHPEQNHHIIPRQAAKLKQTKVARKEGFKVDGRENKISVSRFSRQDGEGQHSNHPNYNKQILDELRNMTEEKGGPSLAEQFRNLVEKIRHIIMENPKTKINDIELKSTNSTTIKK
jgi:RHS repeat-associated protein